MRRKPEYKEIIRELRAAKTERTVAEGKVVVAEDNVRRLDKKRRDCQARLQGFVVKKQKTREEIKAESRSKYAEY